MNQVLRMLLLVIMNSFQHKKVAAVFPFFQIGISFLESLFGWKRRLQLLPS